MKHRFAKANISQIKAFLYPIGEDSISCLKSAFIYQDIAVKEAFVWVIRHSRLLSFDGSVYFFRFVGFTIPKMALRK